MNNESLSNKQQGAALITALVILVALTVIGISAFKTTNLEEIMAGNLRDKQISFQAAESAIAAAENDLDARLHMPEVNSEGSDGVYTRERFGDFCATAHNTSTWDNHGTIAANLSEVSRDPEFITQYESFTPDDLNMQTRLEGKGRFYYRLNSRGEGTSSNAVTLLQETYGKRYR